MKIEHIRRQFPLLWGNPAVAAAHSFTFWKCQAAAAMARAAGYRQAGHESGLIRLALQDARYSAGLARKHLANLVAIETARRVDG